jgi:CheY-like chemotaxis protein
MMSPKKRILLAEDCPQDVEMTLAALSEHQLTTEIVVVSDGEQALDFMFARGAFTTRSPGNPMLVLLDLKMPKIDGLEVLHTIKSNHRLHTTPVVMLTSSREEQDVLRSYQSGTNAYVVKPVDFPAFLQAVHQLGTFWMNVNEPPPLLRPVS